MDEVLISPLRKKKVKNTHKMRCFLWRQNNPEVKYSPTRISEGGGTVSRGSITQPQPQTSSLLGSNILPSTLFSNTLMLCSSLSVSDHVSHPYKTTGRAIVLYKLIFKFWGIKLRQTTLHRIIVNIPCL